MNVEIDDDYTTLAYVRVSILLDAGYSGACDIKAERITDHYTVNATFVEWILTGSFYNDKGVLIYQTFDGYFYVDRLYTDSIYLLNVIFYDPDNSWIYTNYNDRFTTFPDISYIDINTLIVKTHPPKEANVKVDVKIFRIKGRTDNYWLDLYIGLNKNDLALLERKEILTYDTNITVTEDFEIKNLKEGRKYYCELRLVNSNAGIIDEGEVIYTIQFITFIKGFKLWMYLWYKL